MPDAELLPAWRRSATMTSTSRAARRARRRRLHVQCRPVGVPEQFGTATYDESALPENDLANPEDELGGRAI